MNCIIGTITYGLMPRLVYSSSHTRARLSTRCHLLRQRWHPQKHIYGYIEQHIYRSDQARLGHFESVVESLEARALVYHSPFPAMTASRLAVPPLLSTYLNFVRPSTSRLCGWHMCPLLFHASLRRTTWSIPRVRTNQHGACAVVHRQPRYITLALARTRKQTRFETSLTCLLLILTTTPGACIVDLNLTIE